MRKHRRTSRNKSYIVTMFKLVVASLRVIQAQLSQSLPKLQNALVHSLCCRSNLSTEYFHLCGQKKQFMWNTSTLCPVPDQPTSCCHATSSNTVLLIHTPTYFDPYFAVPRFEGSVNRMLLMVYSRLWGSMKYRREGIYGTVNNQ